MPALSWPDLSAIIFGKVMAGDIPAKVVNPDSLTEPYPRAFRMLRKKAIQPDKIIELVGVAAYKEAVEAAKATKGLPSDWPTLLDRAAGRYEAGVKLEKFARRLQQGEVVDEGQLLAAIRQVGDNRRQVVNLADVKAEKMPIKPTGWKPLDDHFGGLPSPGLTTVGAPPGTGKTTLAIKIAAAFARHKKRVVMFSMEMTAAQLALRYLEVANLSAKEKAFVYICEDIISPDEAASIASRVDDAALVILDFAELMLLGDDTAQTEQRMAHIYVSLANASTKQLGIPFLLLAQLNRASYADGAVPGLAGYRYSGLAEALSAAAGLIHNPTSVYIASPDDAVLPPERGRAYLIWAKSRFGFQHGARQRHEGPGAIQVSWNQEKGWGDDADSKWFDLHFGGTNGGFAKSHSTGRSGGNRR